MRIESCRRCGAELEIIHNGHTEPIKLECRHCSTELQTHHAHKSISAIRMATEAA